MEIEIKKGERYMRFEQIMFEVGRVAQMLIEVGIIACPDNEELFKKCYTLAVRFEHDVDIPNADNPDWDFETAFLCHVVPALMEQFAVGQEAQA
jgi:hypothetical protein